MRGTREVPECRAAASGSQQVDVRLAQLRGLLGESGKRLVDSAMDVLAIVGVRRGAQQHASVERCRRFQQCRRMVGRPSCRLWLDAAKAKPGQIKLIDQDIDRPVLSSPNSHLTARETKCSDCGQSPTTKRVIESSGHIAEESYHDGFHTAWTLTRTWARAARGYLLRCTRRCRTPFILLTV